MGVSCVRNKYPANCWVLRGHWSHSHHNLCLNKNNIVRSPIHDTTNKERWDLEVRWSWVGCCVGAIVSGWYDGERRRTCTFQVAPEAGWARRKGPVTLLARLMPTAALACRRSLPECARIQPPCSSSRRPDSTNKIERDRIIVEPRLGY